jgi:uncharacterized membrane protein YgcG
MFVFLGVVLAVIFFVCTVAAVLARMLKTESQRYPEAKPLPRVSNRDSVFAVPSIPVSVSAQRYAAAGVGFRETYSPPPQLTELELQELVARFEARAKRALHDNTSSAPIFQRRGVLPPIVDTVGEAVEDNGPESLPGLFMAPSFSEGATADSQRDTTPNAEFEGGGGSFGGAGSSDEW